MNDDAFAELEHHIRSHHKLLDERGRATERAAAVKKAFLTTYLHRNSAKTASQMAEFETRFNETLAVIAGERVTAAKAKLPELRKYAETAPATAKKLPRAYASIFNATQALRLVANETKANGAPSVSWDHAFGSLNDLENSIDGIDSHVQALIEAAELFAEACAKRADEVENWPQPSVHDLETLYAEGVDRVCRNPFGHGTGVSTFDSGYI
ncbi:MAG: hypothetical protein H6905_01830 [Hyphomicrobiales bacterium]|nr:hypothetical protein [Hyphomicrobiales bacterium]